MTEAGIAPRVVTHHQLTVGEAEVIVVLAACLHDLGIVIHRDEHERYSLILVYPKARQLLTGLYDEPALTTILAEVLYAVIAHRA